MAKDDKFDMPVPQFADLDPAIEALEDSHFAWLKDAVTKAPEDAIIAIILRSAASGAVLNDISKEDFLALAAKAYTYGTTKYRPRRG